MTETLVLVAGWLGFSALALWLARRTEERLRERERRIEELERFIRALEERRERQRPQ